MDERLDVLVCCKYGVSRERAKELITGGKVRLSGEIVTKPGMKTDISPEIAAADIETKYVSRGGIKLEAALDGFGICADGKLCADIGSSTGGFTDCLLQRGAEKVYAVDSGTEQLHGKLRGDPRVVSLERTNIRRFETDDGFRGAFDLITADVSFISLEKIIPAVRNMIRNGGELVCLIKPQFEAGAGSVGRRGVVKNPKVREKIIKSVTESLVKSGFEIKGLMQSPIYGRDGNAEYLAYGVYHD